MVRSQLRWEMLKVAVCHRSLGRRLSAIALFSPQAQDSRPDARLFWTVSLLYGIRLLAIQGVVRCALRCSAEGTWILVNWFITCTINVPIGLFIYRFASEHFRRLFRWLIAIQTFFAVFGLFAPLAGVRVYQLQDGK